MAIHHALSGRKVTFEKPCAARHCPTGTDGTSQGMRHLVGDSSDPPHSFIVLRVGVKLSRTSGHVDGGLWVLVLLFPPGVLHNALEAP